MCSSTFHAGNPHAGFDEAGIGNGSMVALLGHSRQETGSNRSAQPKEPRQSSTLPMNGKVIQGRGSDHPGPEPCEGGPQGRTRSVGQGNMRAGYRAPKYAKPGSRRCRTNRKATRRCATARVQRHPAESKNPRTHRYSVRENRETPLSPVAEKRRAGGRKREHISPTCTVAGSRTAE
jgi:hypothetical protein